MYRNPSVFRKFSGIEKNLWIRGGISRFSVEIFMSHSAENFRKGILLFLRKFLVSKSSMDEIFRGHPFNASENLGYRKILCIIGVSQFSVENFLSHSAEKFRGHPFNVSRKFGVSKNFLHNRGYRNFPPKNVCLTVPKKFVGIPSMSRKIWGVEKFYA